MIKKASYSLIKMESCLCQLSMIIIIKCKDNFLFVISLIVILFVGQKKVYSVSEYSKMQKIWLNLAIIEGILLEIHFARIIDKLNKIRSFS